MKFTDISKRPLLERYRHARTEHDKERYLKQAFALIDSAYGPIGGHVNYPNEQALLDDSDEWKMAFKNGVMIAIMIYKNRLGRKTVALGQNGTREAKMALKRIIAEDIKFKRMWVEASGATLKWLEANGLPKVPNKYAEQVLQKEILAYHGEYAYDRLIGGHVHTKTLFGFPKGEHLVLDTGVVN